MYTLINGSPKIKDSNSFKFLNFINSNIDEYNFFELKNSKYDEIIKSITISDTIVFAFPLYVDSPPSLVLSFFDYILDNEISLDGKIIYLIINCGFREGEQNKTAVEIMKRWCSKVNAIYGCSILIGAGEVVGKEKYRFISNKAFKCLKKFSSIVSNREISNDIITTMDLLNNRIYCSIANMFWNKNARRFNLSKFDIKSK